MVAVHELELLPNSAIRYPLKVFSTQGRLAPFIIMVSEGIYRLFPRSPLPRVAMVGSGRPLGSLAGRWENALEKPFLRGVPHRIHLLDRFDTPLFRMDLKDRPAREAFDRALIVIVGVVQVHLVPAGETVDSHIFSSEFPLDDVRWKPTRPPTERMARAK
jgi:hypothetical protein